MTTLAAFPNTPIRDINPWISLIIPAPSTLPDPDFGGSPMAARFQRAAALLFAFLQGSLLAGSPTQQVMPQQATAASSAVVHLSLKEAVQLALKQNPQRLIAQILVLESDRNSQIARSALLPQAGVAALGARNQYNLQSVERSPRTAAGPFGFIEAGPTFSQSILNLPLIRGYQIAQEGTHQA